MRSYDVVVERDEDGWFVGSVLDVRGCRTQGRTLDQLLERMPEAIDACVGAKDVEIGRVTFAE